MRSKNYVISFSDLGLSDIEDVGGKNASLGEMISNLSSKGVRVPNGFATTSHAFLEFLEKNNLRNTINNILNNIDVENIEDLEKSGKKIRKLVMDAKFSDNFVKAVKENFDRLTKNEDPNISFAVRSSATAEDLPDASFAGQQESYLNIQGIDNILHAMKLVFASLYNDRAISYRVHQKFDHSQVFLSAGVQKMVRSDSASSGVMFTIDTESGFDKVVFITSAYGLGETVVQGQVNPDEFYVYKPNLKKNIDSIIKKVLGSKTLKMIFSDDNKAEVSTKIENVPIDLQRKFSISNDDIIELSKYALIIEKHYARSMDIEWGKDGVDGKIYILQARPETVRSTNKTLNEEKYKLKDKGEVLISGRAIGRKIGQGKIKLIKDASEMFKVGVGDILVTDMTDPDWEPVMKKASAIVTNRGGRTCHAAIIARELGIPAIVGCENATDILVNNSNVTVSCAEGDTGFVYEGLLSIEVQNIEPNKLKKLPVKVMMNVGNPDLAFDFQRIPNDGVGLARLEFVIARMIGIHPKAALYFDSLDEELKKQVLDRIVGYKTPKTFYIEKLTEGVATLAAAFNPKPVIVRLSDFKSNEYSSLIGGKKFEPNEENPMIGFRGASRYISKNFEDCFELECEALKRVRNDMQLTNVQIMVPFVRTLTEAKKVIEILDKFGLTRGINDLKIIMMCEVPSNAILADQFLNFFDGFSIGSNDMTQLTLGLDRDSGIVAGEFDERDPAIKKMLELSISACKKRNKYVGICGQGPSDYPDFAKWLMLQEINSISLNPDTVVQTWTHLGKNFGN